ncbi:MAG: MinD/ParA family protein [bacterium]|nr:MinD/ParA family protein [bacterium]
MDQATSLRNVVKKQNTGQPHQTRVITITSGKGGVGKSNTTVNLAIQLSKIGKKVIIFDADIGLANVEVMFGAIPKYNLSDVIYRGKSIREVITQGPLDIGFISGGSGIIGLNNLSRDQLVYLVHNLSELDALADFILIDTGAGISDSVMEFVLASPEILMVTTPEPSSLTDSYSLLKSLHRNPNYISANTSINLVANRVFSTEDGQAVYEKLQSVVSQFLNETINYVGLIPNDPAIEKAIRQQQPVSLFEPNAPASKAFELLADNLVKGENKYYSMRGGITKLLYSLLNKK